MMVFIECKARMQVESFGFGALSRATSRSALFYLDQDFIGGTMHSLLNDYAAGLLKGHEPPCLSLYQPTHRHHPANVRRRGDLSVLRRGEI
jgi:hypothetical protein